LGATLITAILLQRRGAIGSRQVAFAVLLGGVGFGLGLIVVFFAALAIWFRPGRAITS
jgi:hypothetical protein